MLVDVMMRLVIVVGIFLLSHSFPFYYFFREIDKGRGEIEVFTGDVPESSNFQKRKEFEEGDFGGWWV